LFACVLGRRRHRIWQKKAYVVQGCGERLQKVKQDFMNYDVEQLVSQASVQTITAWPLLFTTFLDAF
jgi:hypothetical protein